MKSFRSRVKRFLTMQNGFQSYILHYDGNGRPSLARYPLHLHPATAASPDLPEGKFFLVGGFSTLITDSPAPVSPTLQLNGDLGDFSDRHLADIAVAEMGRLNRINFRSFIKEINPRVVVIGTTATDINRFLDTYGGVLEIEPLLTRGVAPHIATAEELRVHAERGGLRLDFLTRTPIDHASCTYCGACGPICPEQCIDEHLFLDLTGCSFCKKCVQACPQQAIDLYGVEKQTLRTPALLLLAGVDIDHPDNVDHIYKEENIARLFASICGCRIDETIVCDQALCQYIGRLDQGCNRCLQACRHGAIQKDEKGIHVDQERCVECGNCVALCPTGAMQTLRFSDPHFVEYFRDIPLPPGATIVIGNEDLLHNFWWLKQNTTYKGTFFLVHPGIETLSCMHFLFLLAVGAGRVILLTEGEPTAAGLNRQVEQANSFISDLFSGAAILTAGLQELPSLLAATGQPSDIPRYSDFSFTGRRQKLASLLSFFMEHGLAQKEYTGELFAEFGSVVCDQARCSVCLACVGECRIDSLVADSDRFALLQTPVLCSQCSVCVSLCPEDALALVPGLNLKKDIFTPRLLSQAEPIRCHRCGKIFGTRQSFERVMQVLHAKQPELDLDLFSYCEDCRVLEMIEGANS